MCDFEGGRKKFESEKILHPCWLLMDREHGPSRPLVCTDPPTAHCFWYRWKVRHRNGYVRLQLCNTMLCLTGLKNGMASDSHGRQGRESGRATFRLALWLLLTTKWNCQIKFLAVLVCHVGDFVSAMSKKCANLEWLLLWNCVWFVRPVDRHCPRYDFTVSELTIHVGDVTNQHDIREVTAKWRGVL